MLEKVFSLLPNKIIQPSFFMLQNKLVFFMIVLSCQLYADDSWKVYDDTEIATINITIDADDLEWMYNWQNVESDSLHPATIHFQNAYIDETIDSIGFRLRGNTSRTSAKKSFKVDFNHFFPGREFFDVEKLNLNGEHNDPSIVRSKVCWDLFQDIGMVGSRAAHAKVFINGDYFGLYVSVEHVDDSFLSRNYADDSGNLWKCLWPADLSYRGDDPEDYHPYYDDKRPYELKTNKDEYDYSKLARLIRILHQTPDSLELVLDIKETIQYFAMNILTGSWDDYRFLKNNYYLYHDPSDDLIHWIPYDYDNTFSIDWFDIDWSTIDPYDYAVIDNDGRPLTEYLFSQTRYKNLFSHFLQFYKNQLMNLDTLQTNMEFFVDYLYTAAEEDIYRTLDYGFTLDDFVNSYGYDFQNAHVKQGIMEFFQHRESSLDDQINFEDGSTVIYEAGIENNIMVVGDTVNMAASLFGSPSNFHMFYAKEGATGWNSEPVIFSPDTLSDLIEDHDRWTADIAPDSAGHYYWYLFATSEGVSERYPVYDFMSFEVIDQVAAQPVVINELLAINETTNMDEAGEYDDWIELWNYSDVHVDLSGHYLTDINDNLEKWQFPDSGVVIDPGEFLIIWCDEDQEQGSLHTNFKLSSGGEYLALVLPDGQTILDSITFPVQDQDVSYGRSANDQDQWIYMTPSPGASNSGLMIQNDPVPADAFRINRLYPNPFNSSLRVEFTMDKVHDPVEIHLISLTGRTVFTTQFEVNHPGHQSIPIHMNNLLGSGFYFLHMKTSEHTETRKVLFLK
ncbi:MAG: CotH kinase family protein [Candidatus Marinimicrobia bacterium]|nr:CotH kinase family protein [Candidatus Neomarinimicrobiota bacterium]